MSDFVNCHGCNCRLQNFSLEEEIEGDEMWQTNIYREFEIDGIPCSETKEVVYCEKCYANLR
jgi:hypothetical protein